MQPAHTWVALGATQAAPPPGELSAAFGGVSQEDRGSLADLFSERTAARTAPQAIW